MNVHYTEQPLSDLGNVDLGIKIAGLRRTSEYDTMPIGLDMSTGTTMLTVRNELLAMVESAWECGSKHHWPWLDRFRNPILCANTVRHNNAYCTHGHVVALRKAICVSVVLSLLRPESATNVITHIESLQRKMDRKGDQPLIQIAAHLLFPESYPGNADPTKNNPAYMERLGHAVKRKFGKPIQDVAIRFNHIFQHASEMPNPDSLKEFAAPHIRLLLRAVTRRNKKLFPSDTLRSIN